MTKYVYQQPESINTYYVICHMKNCMVGLLKSKKSYSDNIKKKLIERFVATSHYEVALPDNPNDMIEFIFIKIMVQSGFKVRENQIELSKMIYNGIKENHIAICEAEVGTGKTYAYIVASIVYALYERQRRIKSSGAYHTDSLKCSMPCVISTSSIELQNAIIKAYVPILSDILQEHKVIDHPLSAVLRKGKEHYFCLLRYNRLMNYLKSSEKAVDRELLNKLDSFKIPEKGIDLDEYKGLKNHIIQKINVPKACEVSCPHYKECQYIKYMDYMKSSVHDFQVCNHNYYLADTIKRAKGKYTLIPEHSPVIIDEAHKLPDAAIQILGKRFSSEDITGMSNVLKSNLKGNKVYLKTAKQKLDNLCALRSKFFKSLISKINIYDDMEEDTSQINIQIGSYEKTLLLNMLKSIEDIKMYCKVDISRSRVLGMMFEEIGEQIKTFYHTDKIVYWLENPMSEKLVSVCCIPTDLEEQLHNVLWKNGIPKILTSATLSDDRGFKYFKNNTGIDKVNRNNLSEISFPSPFDYKNNTLLYISENVPFPDKVSDDYLKSVADEIIRIVEATHGHTVILFTSYSLMSKVYEQSRYKIRYPVMKMDKSEKNIVETFKNSKNGVLFATGSFWEGVDCPGDILSSLIIVNLPFPTPTPIFDYKKKQYEQLKEFIEYIIFPEMLIKLKQGMGRLIRCETDTGLISILDFRLSKKGKYRRRVLEALKDYRVTDSLYEVREFFREVKKEEYFL
ncbi:ATP-dependent DNA helicase [Clostridium tyrobutyricum]|uniref:ATP-dependent DNA helicase n=2 Tax=Clostridium tyrobutyricum TaxID=1519 RepID=UPI0030CB74D5